MFYSGKQTSFLEDNSLGKSKNWSNVTVLSKVLQDSFCLSSSDMRGPAQFGGIIFFTHNVSLSWVLLCYSATALVAMFSLQLIWELWLPIKRETEELKLLYGVYTCIVELLRQVIYRGQIIQLLLIIPIFVLASCPSAILQLIFILT